mmetsp:Transcript_24349/g.27628  ORF Transcript_24349/g.27628 Transcript_24349/m.27628 type:complete len:126 (+) Transcript_24349:55-432(+)
MRSSRVFSDPLKLFRKEEVRNERQTKARVRKGEKTKNKRRRRRWRLFLCSGFEIYNHLLLKGCASKILHDGSFSSLWHGFPSKRERERETMGTLSIPSLSSKGRNILSRIKHSREGCERHQLLKG